MSGLTSSDWLEKEEQMTIQELTQNTAEVHNRLAQILVRGDDAILMGATLQQLRWMLQDLKANGVTQTQAKGKAEPTECGA